MLSQKAKKLSGLDAEWGCGAVELRRGTFSRISGLLCYDWRVKKLSRTGQTGAWVQASNLSGVAAIAIHIKVRKAL
jgi:hypothetical protein